MTRQRFAALRLNDRISSEGEFGVWDRANNGWIVGGKGVRKSWKTRRGAEGKAEDLNDR